MAGALTPKQHWAVIQKYGSVDNAIPEALKRSPELQELWESQYTMAWWPSGDFWSVWWESALPVLGITEGAPTNEAGTSALPESPPAKIKSVGGRPKVIISRKTLHSIFRQSLERARSTTKPAQPTFQMIADANGVKRTWVTPIVEWAIRNQEEALRAIRLSETPPKFSTIVRD